MTTLVLGATGATGQRLVEQLLNQDEAVLAIVRSAQSLPNHITSHERFSMTVASVLDLNDKELATHVEKCDAVALCLGHTLSLKGLFLPPWRLVTDATRRVCQIVEKQDRETPIKFVLMNTTGNRNRDLSERISVSQQLAIGLIRLLLPPHADNENAADYLRKIVSQDHRAIEWVVVRPDGLTDEPTVTDFSVYPSPTRSAIFDAGTTSRINVAAFMAELILNQATWTTWQGKMPVIYNN